ncbi:MAG: CCA tRNA nucleotidyltransferase [Candidatus Hadarchaeales archaeon]
MHEEILRKVLEKVKPSNQDLTRMLSAARKLQAIAEKKMKQLGIDAKVMLVGSAARGTWLKGEKDIDLLLLFPEKISEEEMEFLGMKLAREIAGSSGKEEYAEHPYVRMVFEGFEVDLVPCFDISDPTKTKSAPDRTPHHQQYIKERIKGKLADEVLLLKQFAIGIGIYGAEAKVQGFSGYLCELLILHYGSFMELVKNACNWYHGVVIDIEKFYSDRRDLSKLFPNQPLIVIDPVDPKRNVAAAVSHRSFSVFIQACRDFLKSPSLNFFFPRPPRRLTQKSLREILKQRETRFIVLYIKHDGMSEEVMYPQLRKTAKAIHTGLVQRGFSVLRYAVWSGDRHAAIVMETFPKKLPNVEARVGPRPPIDSSKFIETYINSERTIVGPTVNEFGNIVFEIERKWRDPVSVIKDLLQKRLGFGKDVADLIMKGNCELLIDAEASKLLRNEDARLFLSEYFDDRLPWYR